MHVDMHVKVKVKLVGVNTFLPTPPCGTQGPNSAIKSLTPEPSP